MIDSNLTYPQVAELERNALVGFSDNGHSLISPSGASSWSKCVGYVRGIHNSRSLNPDNPASVEGTAGHFILEICLTYKVDPLYFHLLDRIPDNVAHDIKKWRDNVIAKEHNSPDVHSLVVRLADSILKREVDQEFKTELHKVYEHIEKYLDLGYKLVPEARVSLFDFLWHKQCDGTSDIVMFSKKYNHIIIADLKYGRGIEVFPENSKQLMLYALGVMSMLSSRFDLNTVSIDIVICQPRINNRSWDLWSTDYKTLYNFAMMIRVKSWKALAVIGDESLITEEDFVPSVKSCMFCSHKKDCKPRFNKVELDLTAMLADSGINLSSNLIPESADSSKSIGKVLSGVTTPELVKMHLSSPFILGFLKDVESELKNRADKGNPIKGMKLVSGRNSRKWKVKADQLEVLLKDRGLYDDLIVIKLPSPAYFCKKTVDSDDKEFIMTHIETVKGRPILTSESDRRLSLDDEKNKVIEDVLKSSNIKIKE